MESEITGAEGERQNTKGRIQDGLLGREASQNYRYAKETLHLCGFADIQ